MTTDCEPSSCLSACVWFDCFTAEIRVGSEVPPSATYAAISGLLAPGRTEMNILFL